MRKLIIAVMLALAVFTINAEVKQEGRVFIEQSKAKETQPVQKTDYVYIDSNGESHSIYISANGKAFVYMTSKKTGKVYKKYLPEVTNKLSLTNNKKKDGSK